MNWNKFVLGLKHPEEFNHLIVRMKDGKCMPAYRNGFHFYDTLNDIQLKHVTHWIYYTDLPQPKE